MQEQVQRACERGVCEQAMPASGASWSAAAATAAAGAAAGTGTASGAAEPEASAEEIGCMARTWFWQ